MKTLLVAAALLTVGFLVGGGQLVTGTSAQAGVCKNVCEAASIEYAFVKPVDGINHCFCQQKQTGYNFDKDVTLEWTQAFDVGIVRDAEITNSIPDEIRAQREQQIALQQQLLQQQGQQPT